MHRLLSAWNRLLFVVGVAGSLLTITGAIQGWWPKSFPDARLAIIGLLVIVVALALSLVWQEYRYAHKARYAESLRALSQLWEELSTVQNHQLETQREVLEVAQRTVNRLAHAFSLITATNCSVCIKALAGADNFLSLPQDAPARSYVHTLCRDDNSSDREFGPHPEEREIYELENPSAFKNYVDKNTDFAQILEGTGTPKRYFICNDLPSLHGYQNSSFHHYGEPPASGSWSRNRNWTLPYKSTMVVPISRRSLAVSKSFDLKGFLCIDSGSRNVFQGRYDVEILQSVGRALAPLLERYDDVSNNMRI